jgi:hypothetical protein
MPAYWRTCNEGDVTGVRASKGVAPEKDCMHTAAEELDEVGRDLGDQFGKEEARLLVAAARQSRGLQGGEQAGRAPS